MLFGKLAERIVVRLFTSMLEEQSAPYQRVAKVPGHGPQRNLFGIAAGHPAPFGMRKSHVAGDWRALVLLLIAIKLFGNELSDLSRAETGGENQSDLVRSHA